jgi:hypothetical protein
MFASSIPHKTLDADYIIWFGTISKIGYLLSNLSIVV